MVLPLVLEVVAFGMEVTGQSLVGRSDSSSAVVVVVVVVATAIVTVCRCCQGCRKIKVVGSLVPRPKQPQRGSLQVSRQGGGFGDLIGGSMDLCLKCKHTQLLVNYHILLYHCFRSPFRSMLTPTREAIDAAMMYGREKTWSSYVKTRAREGNQ